MQTCLLGNMLLYESTSDNLTMLPLNNTLHTVQLG